MMASMNGGIRSPNYSYYTGGGSSESSSDDFVLLSNPDGNYGGVDPDPGGPEFQFNPDFYYSIQSALPDLSPDEMIIKLRELLEENLELKKIMQHNNVAMKEQYLFLTQWKKQVTENQQKYNARLEDAKGKLKKAQDEAETLRERNLELETNKDSNFRELSGQLRKRLAEAEQKYEASLDENRRNAILEHQLREELKQVAEDYQRLKANYDKNLVAIRQKKMEELDSGNVATSLYDKKKNDELSVLVDKLDKKLKVKKEKWEKTKLDLLKKIEFLEKKQQDSLELERLNAGGDSAAKAKAQALQKQIDSLRKKNDNQAQKIDQYRQIVESDNLQRQKAAIFNELNASGAQLQIANSNLEKYSERCQSLQTYLSTCQQRIESIPTKDDVIVKLRVEISSLRATLEELRADGARDKDNLSQTQIQFDELARDYKTLLTSWENFERMQGAKDRQSDAYYGIQTRNLQTEIDQLTARLVGAEEAYKNKAMENDILQGLVREHKAQMETIPILQAQLEVYRSDFEAERASRQEMHSEKEKLAKEVRELQARLNALEAARVKAEEGNPLSNGEGNGNARGRRFRESAKKNDRERLVSNYSGSSSSRGFSQEAPAPPNSDSLLGATGGVADDHRTAQYLCPKCEFGFNGLEALNNHIDKCLMEDDQSGGFV